MNEKQFNDAILFLEESIEIKSEEFQKLLIEDFERFCNENNFLNESSSDRLNSFKWKYTKWSFRFLKEETMSWFLNEYYKIKHNEDKTEYISSMNKKEKLQKIYDIMDNIPVEKRMPIFKNINVDKGIVSNKTNVNVDTEKGNAEVTGVFSLFFASIGAALSVASGSVVPALILFPIFAGLIFSSGKSISKIRAHTRVESLYKIRKFLKQDVEVKEIPNEIESALLKIENIAKKYLNKKSEFTSVGAIREKISRNKPTAIVKWSSSWQRDEDYGGYSRFSNGYGTSEGAIIYFKNMLFLKLTHISGMEKEEYIDPEYDFFKIKNYYFDKNIPISDPSLLNKIESFFNEQKSIESSEKNNNRIRYRCVIELAGADFRDLKSNPYGWDEDEINETSFEFDIFPACTDETVRFKVPLTTISKLEHNKAQYFTAEELKLLTEE